MMSASTSYPAAPLWFSNGVTAVWSGLGNILQSSAAGYASIEWNAAIQLSSRFKVASNSKLFCAVALYQLQEQGKVNVSDPVNLYLNNTDFEYFGFPNISYWCPKIGIL